MVSLKGEVDVTQMVIPLLQRIVYCVCFLLHCGPAYLHFVQGFADEPYGLFHSGPVVVGPSLK